MNEQFDALEKVFREKKDAMGISWVELGRRAQLSVVTVKKVLSNIDDCTVHSVKRIGNVLGVGFSMEGTR